MERRDALRALLATTAPVAGLTGRATATDEQSGSTDTDTTMTQTETTSDATDDCATTDDGVVTVESDCGFDETVERIRNDVEASPLTLVTTIDHAANAESAGLELPPTTVLLFGNPEVGTPLMQDERSVAIDLPQKMLVWEEDGETYVTYNDPSYLAERHDVEGQGERLEQISTVLRSLAAGDD